MKLFIAILAVLASFGSLKALPTSVGEGSKELRQDLKDFLSLLPLEDMKDVVYDYLFSDDEFNDLLAYVMSQAFRNTVMEIESNSEVKKLLAFIYDSGLSIYEYINIVNKLLGFEPIKPLHSRGTRMTGGISGFFKDIEALIPVEKFQRLYHSKLKTSKDFAYFVKRLSSQEFDDIGNKVLEVSQVKQVAKRLESIGVDFKAIMDFVNTLIEVPQSRYETSSTDCLMDKIIEFFLDVFYNF